MNIIFTICAKNYLASAISLKNSVEKTNSESLFYIILADEQDGLADTVIQENNIILARSIGINKYDEMAFKYDVVEFNTSVKPFAFRYFQNKENIEKIMYLDPDIYVYENLNEIWKRLDTYAIVLTPHVVDGVRRIQNNKLDATFLQYGIYNLGFVAISSSEEGRNIIDWWCNRLEEYCYMETPYFVDQKWMDYIPALFPDVFIERSKKYNMAWWNFSERVMSQQEKGKVLDGMNENDVAFVHFSNFKPGMQVEYVRDRGCDISDEQLAIWKKLYNEYEQQLINNGYEKYSVMKYAYNYFSNGTKILKIHRKLLLQYLNENEEKDYFDVKDGGFWLVLRECGLVKENGDNRDLEEYQTSVKAKSVNLSRKSKKQIVYNFLCKMYIKLFGIEKYQNLIGALEDKSKVTNQEFLLRR